MPSGPIKRELYGRPPKHIAERNSLWRLLRLPYAVVNEGRQWLCTIQQYLPGEYGMDRFKLSTSISTEDGEMDAWFIFLPKFWTTSSLQKPRIAVTHFLQCWTENLRWVKQIEDERIISWNAPYKLADAILSLYQCQTIWG